MFKTEWNKLVHENGMIFILFAIALIPAIYCWLYLSSMWDTYGKMDNIPVAVVNHDLSYHYRGKEIHIGKNLVSSLNKSDSLNYHDVSSHIADAGLKNGKYYMIVTIPSNFSSNATSLLGRNPKQLHIYYHISSGRNFIVSKMTAGAANAIEIKISDQVTKMYTQVLLSTISKVSKGMQTASIGNNTLATGTRRLEIGANKTIVGSHQLQSGIMSMQSSLPGNSQTIPIKKGLVGLANGATKIDTALSSEIMGLTALNKGNIFVASKLTAGAQQLSRITDKSKNASYLASPVKATTTDDAKVPNNGTGMAPFAIAIGPLLSVLCMTPILPGKSQIVF